MTRSFVAVLNDLAVNYFRHDGIRSAMSISIDFEPGSQIPKRTGSGLPNVELLKKSANPPFRRHSVCLQVMVDM